LALINSFDAEKCGKVAGGLKCLSLLGILAKDVIIEGILFIHEYFCYAYIVTITNYSGEGTLFLEH
jgi:hypothetical protein